MTRRQALTAMLKPKTASPVIVIATPKVAGATRNKLRKVGGLSQRTQLAQSPSQRAMYSNFLKSLAPGASPLRSGRKTRKNAGVARGPRLAGVVTVEGVHNYKGRQVYERSDHKQFVLGTSKKTGKSYRIFRVRLTAPVRGPGSRAQVVHETVGVNSKGRNIMLSRTGKEFVMAVSKKTGKSYRTYKFRVAGAAATARKVRKNAGNLPVFSNGVIRIGPNGIAHMRKIRKNAGVKRGPRVAK